MGYSIGQLRRSEITNYTTSITYSQGLIENTDSIVTFYDPYLNLTSSNILSSLCTYYMRFTIPQLTNSTQKFSIILSNREADSDNTQTVRSFTVKQGTDTTTFELIFTPNGSYNRVIFQLSRLALDFTLDNGDGTSGRILNLNMEDFSLVNNVVTTLSSMYSDLTTLDKVGIQGPPGLLFTINGEEMRVGRSGIYELYNDNISISYVGFIIKDSLFTQDGKDFFIMDFKY